MQDDGNNIRFQSVDDALLYYQQQVDNMDKSTKPVNNTDLYDIRFQPERVVQYESNLEAPNMRDIRNKEIRQVAIALHHSAHYSGNTVKGTELTTNSKLSAGTIWSFLTIGICMGSVSWMNNTGFLGNQMDSTIFAQQFFDHYVDVISYGNGEDRALRDLMALTREQLSAQKGRIYEFETRKKEFMNGIVGEEPGETSGSSSCDPISY